MQKLRSLWESLRSSLWFVPTLLVLGAVGLALSLIEIDSYLGETNVQKQWPLLFGVGAEGSRGMLSSIASSMITVCGSCAWTAVMLSNKALRALFVLSAARARSKLNLTMLASKALPSLKRTPFFNSNE